MKPPQWFREQLAAEGRRVLERIVTDEEAIVRLKDHVLTKDEGGNEPFAHRIIAEFARRQLKTWLAGHRHVSVDGEPDGQLDMFPDLPRKIEVAPGRFVDQAFMTRKDWTAAVKQADTKASNASGHAEAIKRIAEKVLPLLVDDEVTTADVWPVAQNRASGGAS